jgi:hypothetical protein
VDQRHCPGRLRRLEAAAQRQRQHLVDEGVVGQRGGLPAVDLGHQPRPAREAVFPGDHQLCTAELGAVAEGEGCGAGQRRRVTGDQRAQQGAGLAPQDIQVGPGREFSGHASSMR